MACPPQCPADVLLVPLLTKREPLVGFSLSSGETETDSGRGRSRSFFSGTAGCGVDVMAGTQQPSWAMKDVRAAQGRAGLCVSFRVRGGASDAPFWVPPHGIRGGFAPRSHVTASDPFVLQPRVPATWTHSPSDPAAP